LVRPGLISSGRPSPTPEVNPSGTFGAVPGALICAFIRVSPSDEISEVNGSERVTASAVRMR